MRLEATKSAWRSEDDRGAVLFILTLFLVIFIAVAAVAVDLAVLGARGQDLQNTSDAAALAAVVAYQDEILAGKTEIQAEATALDVARAVMLQNGIDPDAAEIFFDLDVVIVDGKFQLTVTVTDADPDKFLPSSLLTRDIKQPRDDGTIAGSSVTRQATAEFLKCEETCSIKVSIPEPFGGVSAAGDGDGFKPIFVGDRLYAINHNSRDRNIVCVDRVFEVPCWEDGVFRSAYAPSVGYDDRNPEMVHTAVVNNRIYWAATDSNGLRLFCFITGVDVPCTEAVVLDSSLVRIDEDDSPLTSDKDENRGSGTVAVDGKVYVFSDNHRVHCYDPAVGSLCTGFFGGGNPTALGEALFPPANPLHGNHGSSIDRLVHDGRIYSTIHIPVDCSSTGALADPAGKRVVIRNEETGRFLASDTPNFIYATEDGSSRAAWWDVDGGGDELTFQSADHDEYLDASPFGVTDDIAGFDDVWDPRIDEGDRTAYFLGSERTDLAPEGTFVGIVDTDDPTGGFGADTFIDGLIEPISADVTARWNFFPWQCGGDLSFVPGAPPASYFEAGTWLHCFDTNTTAPCSDFSVRGVTDFGPSSLHRDGSRFSGRLWFYYSAGDNPVPIGICSSGYNVNHPQPGDRDPATIEVNCVDMDGVYDEFGMTADMAEVEQAIQNNSLDRPGAWGVPHWNESTNRLFYPTEHDKSRIICYDFDDGYCGDWTGRIDLPPTPDDPDGSVVFTEDYGFVSDGNCIFALGHTAYFWAFKASDVGEKCDPQPLPTSITRCDCGDGQTYRWGELDFALVDLDDFAYFGVRLVVDTNPNADPIFPINGDYLEVTDGGEYERINLDMLEDLFPEGATEIAVQIRVEGVDGEVLSIEGEEFEVRFAQRPKLVD